MTDIFCKLYGHWKQNGDIIFENDAAYSIYSVTPATPGHAIIVAHSHVEHLEQLRGRALELFVDAAPATIAAIRERYTTDPEHLVAFYGRLRRNPPFPASGEKARAMLDDKNLRVVPDAIASTMGINNGEYAGQMVPHLHAQLFPRRGRGLGVVTAMDMLFRSEQ